jgi:hypothetical protein
MMDDRYSDVRAGIPSEGWFEELLHSYMYLFSLLLWCKRKRKK